MREMAIVPPSEGEEPPATTPARSQNPQLSRPLTHQMDLRRVQAQFFDAGLIQPELVRRKPPRADRTITRPEPTSAKPIEKPKERLPMENELPQPSPKPAVPGTFIQAQHTARAHGELTHTQKCLMNGGTVVVAGTVLMVIWKGLGRYLG